MNFDSIPSVWRDKSRDFLLNTLAASALMPMRWRREIYRRCGVDLDDLNGPLIWLSDCKIFGPQMEGCRLQVQTDTFINFGCIFFGGASISIGARCNVAMQVMFCTGTHDLGDAARRCGAARFAPIRVGDGCWIGARVTILPGVTIGEGCIVAAGSVVNQNCAPNGLYAGVPAKLMRAL